MVAGRALAQAEPLMKIVSENSDAEVAANKATEAQQRVERALVDLAANLLRVVRGAGKPYDIVREASTFMKAAADYYEAKSAAPYEPFDEAVLQVPRVVSSTEFGRAASLQADGEDSVVRGALQIAASRLLGQKAQEAAGEREMYQGMRDIAEARDMAAAARAESDQSGS
jgi:hypothetical protein